MRPYILKEITWKIVKESSYELAVLPWGACEAHNYHLPYAQTFMKLTTSLPSLRAKHMKLEQKLLYYRLYHSG